MQDTQSRREQAPHARSFRDLIVWQKALKLAAQVHRETQGWPRHELYGLASQIRKAAASVPGNIAEGSGRGASPDRARFCRIASGSLCEMRTYLDLALELGYLSEARHAELEESADEVSRMLYGLARSTSNV